MASIIVQATANSGRIYSASDAYATVRAQTVGSATDVHMHLGMAYSNPNTRIYRCFGTFDLSALGPLDTIISATIDCKGQQNNSDTDFVYGIYESTYGSIDTGDFDNFPGWETGVTQYTPTVWTDTLNTSAYIDNWGNILTFNGAGETAIQAAFGSDFQFVMLSTEDINASEPATDEYVIFSIGGADRPKLTIVYTPAGIARSRVFGGLADGSPLLRGLAT